ncbi:MAG: FAD-dependent oxidoreductase [Bdellovibrio sp.]|nr:FAD-dependent oxidoreductase [Bdellovibrio sp.]
MIKADCIIVGAGLSGLAASITLQRAGVTSLIIEAEAVVGGRVKTIKTPQGFLTDVGFQVLLSSYPELENFVQLSALNLKKFNSGALVFDDQNLKLLANPLAHPEALFSSFYADLMTTKDRALVLKLILSSQFHRSDDPLGQKSTATFLKDFGFSENFIELFWRPFLTGIFLDSELEIGEQFFKFLMRCFSTGKVSVPENGMVELPLQMAKLIPQENFLLNQKVKSYGSDYVILATGEKINAKRLICAFDPENAQPNLAENNFRMVTTHYFTGENLNETGWGKWLVLVPRRLGMGIDHFCLISSVSEKYGNGTPLLSVSVVGQKNVSVSKAMQELNKIAKRDLKLELVVSHSVPKALPRISNTTTGFKEIDGVIFCGDRWSSPSINGALRSGRLAAEFILKDQ